MTISLHRGSRQPMFAGLCAVAGLALTAGLGGCGRSVHVTRAERQACAQGAINAIAGVLAVRASAITTATSVGGNAMPQCSFSTSLPRGTRITVNVNVDTGPQPYFILERTIVEASQVFTPVRLSPAPVNVPGLGLEAAWFPAETHLMATDGIRLITTTLDWPGASQARKIELAQALTRRYLRTPHGKAAQRLAHGYPSG